MKKILFLFLLTFSVFDVAPQVKIGELDRTYGGRLGDPPGINEEYTNVLTPTLQGTAGQEWSSMVIQTDRKILVAGNDRLQTMPFFLFRNFLARYNPDGTFDTSFGQFGGVAVPDYQGFSTGFPRVSLKSNGKIVVSGVIRINNVTSGARAIVTQLNSDGSVDTSFAVSGSNSFQPGTFILELPGGTTEFVDSAIQPDGKIVALGSFDGNTFLVARLNENGKLDTSFNPTGTTPGVNVIVPPVDSTPNAVALQPDGKIVFVGNWDENSTNKISVGRFNTDGTLDTTFNSTGAVSTIPGIGVYDAGSIGDPNNFFTGIAVQRNGKILITGHSDGYVAFTFKHVVARINSDGSVDTRFAPDSPQAGFALLDIPGEQDAFNDYTPVILQWDGKIYSATNDFNLNSYLLIRWNSNGTRDLKWGGFDGAPKGTVAVPSITSVALRLYPDAKIMSAGEGSVATTRHLNQDTLVSKVGQAIFSKYYGFILNEPQLCTPH